MTYETVALSWVGCFAVYILLDIYSRRNNTKGFVKIKDLSKKKDKR